MKITSNTIKAVISFYQKELALIYTESELQNIVRWILEQELKISTAEIISKPDTRINESDLVKLERMCYDLKRNVPIQYVLGESEFYELKLKVNKHVLIPRPETEELVERILSSFNPVPRPSSLTPFILDMGTGSGCIPIAIKKNIPSANVFALDISKDALEVATYNATQNNANIIFFQVDMLSKNAAEEILSQTKGEKLDVIVSNPPYVLNSEKETLHQRVIAHEPHLALFVEDKDPIFFYRKIAALAKEILKKNGKIYFECHTNYVQSVQQMLVEEGFQNVCIHADLSGLARFCEASTPY